MSDKAQPQTFAPVQFIDTSNVSDESGSEFIRNITSATNGKFDDVSNQLNEKMGRKPGTAISPEVFQLILSQLSQEKQHVSGHKVVPFDQINTHYKNSGDVTTRSMTLGTFLKTHTTGTFLVAVRGMVVTVKDGVIHGSAKECQMIKSRIQRAFKLEPVTNAVQKKKAAK